MGGVVALCLFLSGKMTGLAAERVQDYGDRLVIVIDPGHGGENRGTESGSIIEKEMNMTTALAMYEELSKFEDVTVYLTHTDDVDLSLEERAQFAEEVEADFLFSIHYNASENHTLYGSEVWIPKDPPYHVYGYQFAMEHLVQMQDMGLFLRGVKTRLGEKDPTKDYYGIIRHSVERGIPAVIIEHCHVDNKQDIPFCDTIEKQQAFGRADALSVAKYFGLRSKELGLDFGGYPLAQLGINERAPKTFTDRTPPDVCVIELLSADYDTGDVEISVMGTDYDTTLMYYDYSIDGGSVYSPLLPWPGSDTSYRTPLQDTFRLNLNIPSGVTPTIILRAYNAFDCPAQSEPIVFSQGFLYGQDPELTETGDGNRVRPTSGGSNGNDKEEADAAGNLDPDDSTSEVISFRPVTSESVTTQKAVTLLAFLKICLVLAALLFTIVLISQIVASGRKRKRKKAAGSQSSRPKPPARDPYDGYLLDDYDEDYR